MIRRFTIGKQISAITFSQNNCLVIIIIASFVVYYPVFFHELMTGWDDQWQVVNRFTETGFTCDNIVKIFTNSYYTQYSPVNQCFYMVIYAVGGYNPFYYHLANWLLHVVNFCLVYILLQRILLVSTQLSIDIIQRITFLTTLMFAIHPLQVESVAWVSASKVLSCTFFYLLATWTFIYFLERKKYFFGYYLLSLFFFLCAYGCKEQAVIYPLWITLLCVFFGRSLKSVATWKLVFPFFLMAVGLGLWFIFGVSSFSKTNNIANVTFSWWQRLVFSCYALFEYIFKWYMPYKLMHLYRYPMELGKAMPDWLIFYPLLTVATLWALWRWIKHWAILAGGGFFLVHILLVLHIIPINRCIIVADRYNYLSAVGLSFVVSYFFIQYYSRVNNCKKKMLTAIAIFFFLILGIFTFNRAQLWHDTATIKTELKELYKQR